MVAAHQPGRLGAQQSSLNRPGAPSVVRRRIVAGRMLLDLDNDVLFKVLAFLIPCDLVGIFAFASVCQTAWEETCNWLRTFQVLRIVH